LDEALKTIQAEAQAALDKGLKDKEANKGKESSSTNSASGDSNVATEESTSGE